MSLLPLGSDHVDAVLFDLDGVLTDSAALHARSWKRLFDDVLHNRDGEKFCPFDADVDYRRFVDGKPRYDGIRSFLASRGMKLPEGGPDDPDTALTIHGLGKRKNGFFLTALAENGIATFPAALDFLSKVRAAGLKTALVSSSRNARAIIGKLGLSGKFDGWIDGEDVLTKGLLGKPAPDMFLAAAAALRVEPGRAVVVEDAIAGVEAGVHGRFGLVIGVDRTHHPEALAEAGAHLVVSQLSDVPVAARDTQPIDSLQLSKRRTCMSEWSFVFEGFDPDQESLREALCVLANGYVATRGAAPESRAGDGHYPGTYLAGGYNRLTTEIAGRIIENEDLVNLPNWLPLAIRIDGAGWFDLHKVEILDYRQELDLRHGVLHRWVHWRDAKGQETRIDQRRLVHMANPHLAAIETMIEAVNWSGQIEFRSSLDGRIVNGGIARYQSLSNRHLEPLGTECLDDDIILLSARTSQSRIEITEAARTHAYLNGERIDIGHQIEQANDVITDHFTLDLKLGSRLTVEKVVAIHTSRDLAIASPALAAGMSARRAPDFAGLLESHARAWEQLWHQFEIDVVHNDHETRDLEAQRIVRLHTFHLLQTASPHVIDRDVGIPARGLHGEAYRGHIFWDELFIFPMINLRMPAVTRSLLKYRYRRLDEARIAAAAAGFKGTMYPWQSGSDGREETQQVHLNPKSGRWLPDNSHLQRHVNAAIAYNIWQYYQATSDLEFMAFYGAEMLFEIARFWASTTSYNPTIQRYEIKGVMGPDEYHDGYADAEKPGLDNNAYTNVMAAWCLGRALDMTERLSPDRQGELCHTLSLKSEEIEHWRDISQKILVVFQKDGIISQFEGYEALKEFDWDGYREKYGDIQRLDRILEAEGDSTNRYKLSKQADVLMLFYLFSAEELTALFGKLGYDFDPDTIPKTIDYYTKRTSHGSTLSRVVHGWVLYRSDREQAWKHLREALYSDVADTQSGTTAEGVHLGAMAGTVDALLRIFTGVETRDDVLWLNPFLPEDLKELRLRLRYRGNEIKLAVRHTEIAIETADFPALPITVGCKGNVFELKPGSSRRIDL